MVNHAAAPCSASIAPPNLSAFQVNWAVEWPAGRPVRLASWPKRPGLLGNFSRGRLGSIDFHASAATFGPIDTCAGIRLVSLVLATRLRPALFAAYMAR